MHVLDIHHPLLAVHVTFHGLIDVNKIVERGDVIAISKQAAI